jgi:hypothetical protein
MTTFHTTDVSVEIARRCKALQTISDKHAPNKFYITVSYEQYWKGKFTTHPRNAIITKHQGIGTTMSAVKSPPQLNDWILIDDGLNNSTRKIPEQLAEKLKQGNYYCGYASLAFYALVWWQDDSFQAFIMVLGDHKTTLTAPDLIELMQIVSEQFGFS